MKKTIFLLIGLLAVAVLAYFFYRAFTSNDRILAVYEGMLPAADCPGLRETLTLYEGDPGKYKIQSTYIEAENGKDKTYYAYGKWRKSKGRPGQSEAVLIEIDFDHPAKTAYYLMVDDKTIRIVDKDKKDINCPFNLSLTKKE
ncbi:MAG: copper resistance protein NlpE N-terminal domain-containing protein [bacterium]